MDALIDETSSGLGRVVTCVAPVNIAVVKYWGKTNEDLIIPLNDSISLTLSTEHLRARTTIKTIPQSNDITFELNGVTEKLTKRLSRAIQLCREEAVRQNTATQEVVSAGLTIISDNNFPTAAGLASSAAGFACLVCALQHLYGIQGDVSAIVRQGSGSACRSVFGGFVRWAKGHREDGNDSIARQLFPASHWPELRVLIVVVSDHKKETSSTKGMQTTVETSDLLKFRTEVVVPKRCEDMERAIEKRDFPSFAELTMRDSNQFHATCLDTYPPIFYLNSTSQEILMLCHDYNQKKGAATVAYSFDAGANAFLFTLNKSVPEICGLLQARFGVTDFKGDPVSDFCLHEEHGSSISGSKTKDVVKYVIVTKVGEGAHLVENDTSS
ncbi:hypothetical protein RvY_07700-2 [Ramazzottius varieornatus]|uniref:Diphosphomevalonate decarboxylase n=1 Tax=Ramazzottius varieornatus TaxID=947166 RepID=A0A1D1V649_RAMVA|nr:hypothetical protein RvY_07700-2 [Ramazzottius varieornatus]